MVAGPRAIGPIGTFHGRAGSQDRSGRLALADAVVELAVTGDREESDSGERLVELTVRADFPANGFEVRLELPEHGADRLRDVLELP